MEPYFTTPLIIAEIIFSIMVLIALKNANTKNSVNKTLMFTIGTFLGLWLVSDYLMISNGFFSATGIPQVSFALALAIPVVIGVLAQKFWKPFASTINNMSTSSFLALQQMRTVFGILFFFTAALPVWFQTIGGIGDISAGIGAFLALRHYRKHPDNERQAIIKGNMAGILDFIIVLNLGLFIVLKNESPDVMFNMIPLYVVPIFILLHIFSLQKLRQLNSHHVSKKLEVSHENV